MNMLTHILGIILGAVVLVMCIVKAIFVGDEWGLAASIVYGVSMIMLYTISTIYHGWQDGYQKKYLQAVDHCTIYLLILGTIVPICLGRLHTDAPAVAWSLFGIVCATTIVGIVFTAIDCKKYIVLSMIGYLSPWLLVILVKYIIDAYSLNFIWYLVGGGVAYTIGAVLYGLFSGKVRYMHSVFHIFILMGSIVHFLGIYDLVIGNI